jgi:hypothetical protein
VVSTPGTPAGGPGVESDVEVGKEGVKVGIAGVLAPTDGSQAC